MTPQQRSRFAMWRIWNCVIKAEFIGDIVYRAREIDPNHLYGQNMMWKWSYKYFTYVSLDPEINYAYADILGINIYPVEDNFVRVGDSARFIGSLHDHKKVVWLGEANSKPGYINAATLENFIDEAIDGGCTGYVYFTYSGNAAGDISRYSVMLDNKRTESWYALSRVNASKFGRKGSHKSIIEQPYRTADCYMLWSFTNKFCWVSGNDVLMSQYWNTRLAFRQEGFDVDALSESRLRDGNFDTSKPIIIPSMPVVDEATIGALRRFVKGGGRVMVIGDFASYVWRNGSLESSSKSPRELLGGGYYIDDNILADNYPKIKNTRSLLRKFVAPRQ